MSEKLIPDAAVKAIQDSVQPEVIKVDGENFVTRPIFLPPAEPQPSPLVIHTLTGFVNYAESIRSESPLDSLENGMAIHVVSPAEVNLISGFYGRFRRRDTYVSAQAPACEFPFGQYLDNETFIVKLQSQFLDAEDRENVLRVVGNIKEEGVRTLSDDGVTQSVTARAGIVRVEDVPVPNPVTLVPFRTFREVSQPASQFILRMRQGREGGLPTCALFEADGAQWELTAINAIREFLETETEDFTIIA